MHPNLALIQDWFDKLFIHRDLSVIDTHRDDHAKSFGLSLEPLTGPDELRRLHERLADLVTFDAVVLVDHVIEGDRVAVFVYARGHTKKGAPFEVNGAAFVTIVDGFITRSKNTWDLGSLTAALGQAPGLTFAELIDAAS